MGRSDRGGSQEEEEGTLQVSMFHNVTKIPRKPGYHREKFKLSNGNGSLFKFMENSLFTSLGQ